LAEELAYGEGRQPQAIAADFDLVVSSRIVALEFGVQLRGLEPAAAPFGDDVDLPAPS
jgi:hypothetical protein